MPLIFRFSLRIAALALKFLLTIAIARALGFSAVADYGLALAVSVVASKLLGLGFSAEINRRLSLPNPRSAIRDTRGVLLLYGAAYALIALLVISARELSAFDALDRIQPGVLWGVMLVAFSEHAGLETNSWVFSLHRARAGAIFLFVRTGAWAGVAVLGLMVGAVHSIETVFVLWWATNALVVIAACLFIAHTRKALDRTAVRVARVSQGAYVGHRAGVRAVWIDGLPFFFATVVLSGLQYAERFVASGMVTASELGRYVFAWSIANTIQTIAYATIVVTAGPRLVRALEVSPHEFGATLHRSVRASLGISAGCAAGVLIASKPIFSISHQPAGAHEYALLAILLVSFLLRSLADVLWSSAIALRLGRRVSVAICGVAAVCVPAGWLLIAHVGTLGAAIAHLCASVGIVSILVWLVARAHGSAVSQFRKGGVLHAS
ncbi:Polysaccharide biosynthesis protein [Paraburkholderia tropica]|uniref:lipopolysaccharide biosynthesis protein n=1 Tax=Paraburkholderia tropica TaxID=92647 RepID=UPI001CB60FDA|nr:polysaccharide biosynthesis protein [Paraburkholderia tropica]CAG9238462.1 Polysaccharide biosynthesis protein [Paraburkholderia tropica]